MSFLKHAQYLSKQASHQINHFTLSHLFFFFFLFFFISKGMVTEENGGVVRGAAMTIMIAMWYSDEWYFDLFSINIRVQIVIIGVQKEKSCEN